MSGSASAKSSSLDKSSPSSASASSRGKPLMLRIVAELEKELQHIANNRDTRIIEIQRRIGRLNVKMFSKVENMEAERNSAAWEGEAKLKRLQLMTRKENHSYVDNNI